jgi:hypothetical protein
MRSTLDQRPANVADTKRRLLIAWLGFRYNFGNVKPTTLLAFVLLFTTLSLGEEASFDRVKVPDLKGRQSRAVLTFSDQDKAIEIHPSKRSAVTIPYTEIYKCSYEFTRKHRINEGSVATAPIGLGLIVMLTRSRNHWLEIDYHDQELPKVFVVKMDKHDYIHILDALKAHTGIEADVLGNAQKR